MKHFKIVMALLVALCFSLSLFGCGGGVSEEEHGKVVQELNQVKAELKEAKAKIEELSGGGKASALIEDKLREAQQKAGDLAAKLKNMTTENSELKEKTAQLNAMLEDLKAKLKEFQEKAKSLPADLLQKR